MKSARTFEEGLMMFEGLTYFRLDGRKLFRMLYNLGSDDLAVFRGGLQSGSKDLFDDQARYRGAIAATSIVLRSSPDTLLSRIDRTD